MLAAGFTAWGRRGLLRTDRAADGVALIAAVGTQWLTYLQFATVGDVVGIVLGLLGGAATFALGYVIARAAHQVYRRSVPPTT